MHWRHIFYMDALSLNSSSGQLCRYSAAENEGRYVQLLLLPICPEHYVSVDTVLVRWRNALCMDGFKFKLRRPTVVTIYCKSHLARAVTPAPSWAQQPLTNSGVGRIRNPPGVSGPRDLSGRIAARLNKRAKEASNG